MPTETQKAVATTALTLGLGAAFGTAGYISGGILGSVLFPPASPKAPDPLTGVGMSVSREDAPVTHVCGVNKTTGNFIFQGALRSKKIKKGGKGGKKKTVGHKYYTDFAQGISRGEVDVTRAWKDDDIYVYETDSAATMYRGTTTQGVDPDWDALVDRVSPLKRFAYVMYRNIYLGKNTADIWNMSYETHRFPYESSMDTNPYVFNKVDEKAYGGTACKDKWNDTIVYNREDGNVKVYNSDGTLNKTIDISSLGGYSSVVTGNPAWDMTLTYVGGQTYINLVYVIDGSSIRQQIVVTRFKKSIGALRAATADRPANYTTYSIVDNQWADDIHITSNSDFMFICRRIGGPSCYVHKFASGNPGVELAEYDVYSDMGSTTAKDITCDHNYFFILGQASNKIHMWNLTGTYKGNQIMTGVDSILAMYGGPHLIGYDYGSTEYLKFASYDPDTELFVSQSVPALDMDGYWTSGTSSFSVITRFNSSLMRIQHMQSMTQLIE
jgi:hypothetical protein